MTLKHRPPAPAQHVSVLKHGGMLQQGFKLNGATVLVALVIPSFPLIARWFVRMII
jgi:hypothetical protein